jgi:COP9 signalosome complex subunit 1
MTRSLLKECVSRLDRGTDKEGLDADPETVAQLHASAALLELLAKDFAGAARSFCGVPHLLAAFEHVLPAGDVALYGTLCAVAALPRADIETTVLHSRTFKPYLDARPGLRTLAADYFAGRYKEALAALEALQSELHHDVYLSEHRLELSRLFRRNCLTTYIKPFGKLDLARMAEAFGVGREALEAEVAGLIADGLVAAKIDAARGHLIAQGQDKRCARAHARLVRRWSARVRNPPPHAVRSPLSRPHR